MYLPFAIDWHETEWMNVVHVVTALWRTPDQNRIGLPATPNKEWAPSRSNQPRYFITSRNKVERTNFMGIMGIRWSFFLVPWLPIYTRFFSSLKTSFFFLHLITLAVVRGVFWFRIELLLLLFICRKLEKTLKVLQTTTETSTIVRSTKMRLICSDCSLVHFTNSTRCRP